MTKSKPCDNEHTGLTGNLDTERTLSEKKEGRRLCGEQGKIFTASAAGSTCATSDLLDVSVKSASQVAAKHVHVGGGVGVCKRA